VTSSAYSRSPPTGRPGDPQTHGLDQAGEVGGGGLALEVGVGGDDDLGHCAVGKPHHELAYSQVVRPDALDRADRAAEHVIAAAELAGLLDREDVLRLLDHAQHGLVAPGVAADPALVSLGDVEADPAEPHLVLDLEQDLGQPTHVGLIGLKQVERDPLGALGTDAGESAELVDEVLDHAFVHLAQHSFR